MSPGGVRAVAYGRYEIDLRAVILDSSAIPVKLSRSAVQRC